MDKIRNYFRNRFKNIQRDEWIVIIALFAVTAILLWFSIGMSVSLSKGLTLFGETGSSAGSGEEIVAPTSADITVLTLFWILTVLILALFLYRLFVHKPRKTAIVRKEIVNGKTIIVKEEKEDDERNSSEQSR